MPVVVGDVWLLLLLVRCTALRSLLEGRRPWPWDGEGGEPVPAAAAAAVAGTLAVLPPAPEEAPLWRRFPLPVLSVGCSRGVVATLVVGESEATAAACDDDEGAALRAAPVVVPAAVAFEAALRML